MEKRRTPTHSADAEADATDQRCASASAGIDGQSVGVRENADLRPLPNSRRTIWIIGVNHLLAEALTSLLESRRACCVSGYRSLSDAEKKNPGGVPDVLITMDNGDICRSGALSEMKAHTPDVHVIAICSGSHAARCDPLVKTGDINCLLTPDIGAGQLIAVIDLVCDGLNFVAVDHYREKIWDMGTTPSLDGVTEEEKLVMGCLAIGQSNKEIANSIGETENSVKLMLRHIMRKTKAQNRTQAGVMGANLGMDRLVRRKLEGYGPKKKLEKVAGEKKPRRAKVATPPNSLS